MFYDLVDQSVIFRPATPAVLGNALQMENLHYILQLWNQNLHFHTVTDELLIYYIFQVLLYEINATKITFCRRSQKMRKLVG